MSSQLHWDEARSPLIVVTAPVQWGVDSVVRYMDQTSRLLESAQPFALVLDLTSSSLPSLTLRTRLAAHRRWWFEKAAERLISESVVVQSRAHRESFSVQLDPTTLHPAQRFFTSLDLAVSFSLAYLAQMSPNSAPSSVSGVLWKPLRKAVAQDTPYPVELQLRRSS